MRLLLLSLIATFPVLAQTTNFSTNGGPLQVLGNLTLPVNMGGCGATTAANCLTNLFPTPTRIGDIVYWNGTSVVWFPGNNSGTQVLTESSSGVLSWTTPGGSGTVSVVGAGSLCS